MAKIAVHGWADWDRTGDGVFAFEIEGSFLEVFRKAVSKLWNWEERKGERRRLKLTLEVYYAKRSLAMNALMWALLEIIANEHNAGLPGGETLRDAEYFYQLFLARYAPKVRAHTGEEIRKTSSQFNTAEMATFIDRIFDELAVLDIGVETADEIGAYWLEQRRLMSEKQVILRVGEEYTIAGYKEAVKNCEACSAPVWHEDIGSSLAHIKAVGMGGGRTARVKAEDVMHLCDVCHAEYDNGRGLEAFLKNHGHLEYKIKSALGRPIEQIEETEELDIF